MTQNPIEIPGVGSVAPSSRAASALGPLLGLAVGDALGTTYEFEMISQPPHPTLATAPATDIVGGGPFGLEPGQVTDDTQMAVCIARSLAASEGALDARDLGSRYVAWMKHAFDVGNQTSSALHAIDIGTSASDAGRLVWHRSERRAAGNGSLMRSAPIAVAFTTTEGVIEAAVADSLITHADPRCVLACAAFDAAIAHALSARPETTAPTGNGVRHHFAAADMLAAARRALPTAADILRARWHDNAADLLAVDGAFTDLERDLTAAESHDPDLYGADVHLQRMAGFVRVAFRFAFWHLVHTPSWRDAVIDTASRGGDADTNTAIVGALLGARDGVRAIPPAWIECVLGATLPGDLDWASAHHPRHLLALAQR
jgi:ADP-ribosyl-[dinitrogen reductase] hydrolase